MSKAFDQLAAGDRIEVRVAADRWVACTVRARSARHGVAAADDGGMVILTPATQFRAVTA